MLSHILMEMSLLLLIFYNLFLINPKNCEKENPLCFMDNPEAGHATRAETIGGYVIVILISLTLITEILKVLMDVINSGKNALGCGSKNVSTVGVATRDINSSIDDNISPFSQIDSVEKRIKLEEKSVLNNPSRVHAKIRKVAGKNRRRYFNQSENNGVQNHQKIIITKIDVNFNFKSPKRKENQDHSQSKTQSQAQSQAQINSLPPIRYPTPPLKIMELKAKKSKQPVKKYRRSP